jgi:sentrin-specific protease 7
MRMHGFLPALADDTGAEGGSSESESGTADTRHADNEDSEAESDATITKHTAYKPKPDKRSGSRADAIDLVSDSSDSDSDDSVVVSGGSAVPRDNVVRISKGDGTHSLPARLGTVPISNWDSECLQSGQYLNDTIIDWALKLRLLRGVSEGTRKRVHVMSSLFLKELRSHLDKDMDALPPVQRYAAGYAQVAKWTRKVDIFKKDFVIIPVNDRCASTCRNMSFFANASFSQLTLVTDSCVLPILLR